MKAGESFAQAHASLHLTAQIAKEEFSRKVTLPNGEAIDCTPTKKCDLQVDQRDCRKPRNCTHNHGTRNCRTRLGINNPVCEAAKAAQNAAYDTAFNACNALVSLDDAVCGAEKATQNGLYDAAKAKCETEKTGERTLCEGGKATVEAIDRTGNFANIDGSFGTGSAVLDIVFSKIAITDSLDTLNLGMLVSAHGTLTLTSSSRRSI